MAHYSVRAYENSIGTASHQEEFMNEWINEWANSAKGRVRGFLMPMRHHMSEIKYTHTRGC